MALTVPLTRVTIWAMTRYDPGAIEAEIHWSEEMEREEEPESDGDIDPNAPPEH